MPTFAEVNELTTSGGFPERIAFVIFVSLIDPTTFTFTSGCFASYSVTTPLNSFSSRALQPTQIVIDTAFFAACGPALAEVFAAAATAVAPSTRMASRIPVQRLIEPSQRSKESEAVS